MSRSKQFDGFILAGGRSRRMGRDKAFIEIGGQTFIQNALNLLKPFCDEVSVVVSGAQLSSYSDLFPSERILTDSIPDRGAPGGIYTALVNSGAANSIILAVDLPFVTPAALEKLAETSFADDRSSAIVPLQENGLPQPLCGVYKTAKCVCAIEPLIMADEYLSVNDLLGALDVRFIPEREFGGNQNLFKNINFPEDLESIRL